MELSVIIPEAVKEILKEQPELQKKCMGSCKYTCDDMTKFICLGCGPRQIVDYLKRHPNFAKNVVDNFEKEMSTIIDFDFQDLLD